MARPRLRGCSYFSVDVDFDDMLDAMLEEEGGPAALFLLRFWQAAYKTATAEADLSVDILRSRFMRRCKMNEDQLQDMIQKFGALGRRRPAPDDPDQSRGGLVDLDAWNERRVLTSDGVKRRFSAILAERERKRRGSSGVSPAKTPRKCGHKPDSSAESKEKESKEKQGVQGGVCALRRDGIARETERSRANRPEHRVVNGRVSLAGEVLNEINRRKEAGRK